MKPVRTRRVGSARDFFDPLSSLGLVSEYAVDPTAARADSVAIVSELEVTAPHQDRPSFAAAMPGGVVPFGCSFFGTAIGKGHRHSKQRQSNVGHSGHSIGYHLPPAEVV